MQNDCCGSGPHSDGEVRIMPSGGDSNLILCRRCWQHELFYRQDRNRYLGAGMQYKLPAWETAKVYES